MVKAPDLTKKRNFITTLVVILVIAGGAAVALELLVADDKTNTATNQPSPVVNKNEKLADDTVSPSEITAKPTDYQNKKVKVQGVLAKTQSGKYLVAGRDSSKPGAINLDFSKSNIDPLALMQEAQGVKSIVFTGQLTESLLLVVETATVK